MNQLSEPEYLKLFPIEKMRELYPKISEQIIPLSVTGISPRTFFSWKQHGIIDYPDNMRVKLNLFQYTWMMVCVTLRDFGVSLKIMKEVKQSMFEDMGMSLLERKDEILKLIYKNEHKDPNLASISKMIYPILEKEYQNFAQEFRIYTSVLGAAIGAILLLNREATIVITKNKKEVGFEVINYKSLSEFSERTAEYHDKPHLLIPMSGIIADFLTTTKNEKYIAKLELLTKDEKKVIDIIRSKDFYDLRIKKINDEKELKITKSKEKDIKGAQVNEIVRILGLNQYEEVTMHLRSKEHIHFKCKATCK
ncbi:MAG TPA: hypothetical protein PKW80_00750 [Bacteroidales bacterium]|nr:hypothetical protein [Bacteroidales bacterium]